MLPIAKGLIQECAVSHKHNTEIYLLHQRKMHVKHPLQYTVWLKNMNMLSKVHTMCYRGNISSTFSRNQEKFRRTL